MTKPQEYIWIKRWGKLLGSFNYYIEDQQALAASHNAPVNAIYLDNDGETWHLIDEVNNISTRHRFSTMYPDDIPQAWNKETVSE